tara:strand:- start:109 stop:405 length:297 start_codon:yes stop_codon:yes gene_type:complete
MTPESGLKCRWCAQSQKKHDSFAEQWVCADGRVAEFRPYNVTAGRRAASFSADEIIMANALFRAVQMSGDTSTIITQKCWPRLVRKFTRMKKANEAAS